MHRILIETSLFAYGAKATARRLKRNYDQRIYSLNGSRDYQINIICGRKLWLRYLWNIISRSRTVKQWWKMRMVKTKMLSWRVWEKIEVKETIISKGWRNKVWKTLSVIGQVRLAGGNRLKAELREFDKLRVPYASSYEDVRFLKVKRIWPRLKPSLKLRTQIRNNAVRCGPSLHIAIVDQSRQSWSARRQVSSTVISAKRCSPLRCSAVDAWPLPSRKTR